MAKQLKPVSRSRWSADEDETLIENIHRISYKNHKKILPGRTAAAIQSRICSLGLTTQCTTYGGWNYSTNDVSEILGLPRRVVTDWMAKGMFRDVLRHDPLQAPKYGQLYPRQRLSVPPESIDDLLREYPMLFSAAVFPVPPDGAINHLRTLVYAQEQQDWITIYEAARLLGVSARKIRQIGREGWIPSRVVMKNRYFKRADVIAAKSRRSLRATA